MREVLIAERGHMGYGVYVARAATSGGGSVPARTEGCVVGSDGGGEVGARGGGGMESRSVAAHLPAARLYKAL